MALTSDQAVKVLAGLRVAVGASSWLTPRLAGKGFGIDTEANPVAPYLARLFGVRDVALAVGSLASEGDAQRLWLQAGLGCDVADAVAAIFAGNTGTLTKASAVAVFIPAVAAAGLGAMALRGDAPAAPAAGPAAGVPVVDVPPPAAAGTA
jgi:hypothetical protein